MHGLNVHGTPALNSPPIVLQIVWSTSTHVPLEAMQHEPSTTPRHVELMHVVPGPMYEPPFSTQLH